LEFFGLKNQTGGHVAHEPHWTSCFVTLIISNNSLTQTKPAWVLTKQAMSPSVSSTLFLILLVLFVLLSLYVSQVWIYFIRVLS
jgi:hypothetical protein